MCWGDYMLRYERTYINVSSPISLNDTFETCVRPRQTPIFQRGRCHGGQRENCGPLHHNGPQWTGKTSHDHNHSFISHSIAGKIEKTFLTLWKRRWNIATCGERIVAWSSSSAASDDPSVDWVRRRYPLCSQSSRRTTSGSLGSAWSPLASRNS